MLSFFLSSCDNNAECGKSEKDNCFVSKESFDKIQEGDSLNVVLNLLGDPFSFDLVENEKGIRRYSWFRYSIVNNPNKEHIQVFIAIDFKGNRVFSKEFNDNSLLNK